MLRHSYPVGGRSHVKLTNLIQSRQMKVPKAIKAWDKCMQDMQNRGIPRPPSPLPYRRYLVTMQAKNRDPTTCIKEWVEVAPDTIDSPPTDPEVDVPFAISVVIVTALAVVDAKPPPVKDMPETLMMPLVAA
mmetsp:Transcript_39203/g.85682  ORF Transcript_39203/g.85682 Transcript_39203/m.85682 type:complete len:132 (-) Transcript_39203:2439-2834(-)